MTTNKHEIMNTNINMKEELGETDEIAVINLPDDENEALDFLLEHSNLTRVKISGKMKKWYWDINEWINDNQITYLDLYDLTEMKEWGDPMEWLGEPTGGICDCPSLEEVVLPKNLEGLGVNYFQNCSNLETIHIPAALGYISTLPGMPAFPDTSLKKIVLELSSRNSWIIPSYSHKEVIYTISDDNFYVTGGVLFDKRKSQLLSFPKGETEDYVFSVEITSIADYAFGGTRIKKLVIPGQIRHIGTAAFMDAHIDTIIFEEGIERIIGGEDVPEDRFDPYVNGRVFSNCTIRRIILPSSLKEIGYQMFTGSDNIESVSFSTENPVFDIEGDLIYNRELKSVVAFVPNQSNEYTIRAGTKTIGKHLFSYEYFRNKKRKTRITLPESIEIIDDRAFYECNIEAIVLPKNLKIIGKDAFGGTLIENIRIPEAVESIGEGAFSFCRLLKEINLPSSLRKLENGTFNFCSLLENIEMPGCITEIGAQCFEDCNMIKSITLPEDLTDIWGMAFSGCSALETVIFPAGLKRIHDGAFMNCTRLKKIELPESLLDLGSLAFSGCKALDTINIPANCEIYSPGDDFYQFEGCNAIRNVAVSDENPYYTFSDGILYNKQGDYLIKSFSPYKVVEVLERVKIIGPMAFADTPCIAVIMTDNVEKIGLMAFSNCSSLEHIRFSRNIREIAFTRFWRETWPGEPDGPLGGLFDKCINLSRITNVTPKIHREFSEVFKDIPVSVAAQEYMPPAEERGRESDPPQVESGLAEDILEAINSKYFVEPLQIRELIIKIIRYRDKSLVDRRNIYLNSARKILEFVRTSLWETGIIPKRCRALSTGMRILSRNWPEEVVPGEIRNKVANVVEILNQASHSGASYRAPFNNHGLTNNDIIDFCLAMVRLPKGVADYRNSNGLDIKSFSGKFKHCIYETEQDNPEETEDTTVGYIRTWLKKSITSESEEIKIDLVHMNNEWSKVTVYESVLTEYCRRKGCSITEDQKVRVRFEEKSSWDKNPFWVATEVLEVISRPLYRKP